MFLYAKTEYNYILEPLILSLAIAISSYTK